VRIARFSVEGGDPRYGIVDDDELVVLAGDPIFQGFDTTGERVPLADAKLLAPVIPRSKVVCVGLNYPEHRQDMAANVDAPANPLIFLKPNTAVVGPGDAIQIPPVEGRITHESELVVVIGRIAKQVPKARWADYVFGYTCGNDVSARDQMFADGQWARAKGYDTFAPLGPWIETELDPTNLEISSTVDGEARRHGNTKDLLHPIPELIEYISNVWTMLPGDVIMTGTPAGVGLVQAGDRYEVEIEGIGRLSNPVVRR
jgi:2-keto-4-pentenoate hydratase/2-oxohepta-3-ene-1,7-dioic acid hydratase in catechol pathway